MALTKLPLKTALIIKKCAEPSNTASYLLFFFLAFFTTN